MTRYENLTKVAGVQFLKVGQCFLLCGHHESMATTKINLKTFLRQKMPLGQNIMP